MKKTVRNKYKKKKNKQKKMATSSALLAGGAAINRTGSYNPMGDRAVSEGGKQKK